MKCPRCNVELSFQKKRCDNCGQDLKDFRRIYSMSNRFYNLGLEQAKIRDLTGAIHSLKQSLKLWKENTSARNLLGLIYFEEGEIVSALREWVISKNLQEDHNEADYYIQQVQSSPNKLESYNQVIKKYNSALYSAKNGDGDMAIIQLKKVVNMNPKFIRAHQLLALLYMMTEKKENRVKAYKLMRSISKVDVTNTTTLSYMKELSDVQVRRESTIVKKAETPQQPPHRVLPKVDPAAYQQITPYKEEKPSVLPFVHVILGIVIGIVVMRFLIMPHMNYSSSAENNKTFKQYSEQLASGESDLNTLRSENEKLKKQVDTQKEQLDKLQNGKPTDAEAVQITYDNLLQAVQYNTDGKSEKAAQTLLKVDEASLTSTSAKKLYKKVKKATFSQASVSYFIKGRDCYNGDGDYAGKQDYDKAIKLLETALKYDKTNTDAMYFLGRCYQQKEEVDKAKEYYNQVINDYPDSSRLVEAQARLRELGE